jgi:hypothetical protein
MVPLLATDTEDIWDQWDHGVAWEKKQKFVKRDKEKFRRNGFTQLENKKNVLQEW